MREWPLSQASPAAVLLPNPPGSPPKQICVGQKGQNPAEQGAQVAPDKGSSKREAIPRRPRLTS